MSFKHLDPWYEIVTMPKLFKQKTFLLMKTTQYLAS